MADMDRAKVIDAVYTHGRKSFRGLDLSGADLTGLQLDGCDFGGCRLNRTKFDRSNLAGAKFDGANARGASFAGSDLTRASMSRAMLERAGFAEAKLSGVAFDGSDLTDVASINGEACTGCTFDGAWVPQYQKQRINVTSPPMVRPKLDVPTDGKSPAAGQRAMSGAAAGF